MATLKFCLAQDIFDSKRYRFSATSSPNGPDLVCFNSLSLVSIGPATKWRKYILIWGNQAEVRHVNHGRIGRIEAVRGSQLGTELADKPRRSDAGTTPPVNPRIKGSKIAPIDGNVRDVRNRFMHSRKPVRHVPRRKNVFRKGEGDKILESNSRVDAYLSSVNPDSTVKMCNSILQKLEKDNDAGILKFFTWMRSHGKLKRNADAYQLALRAVARRQDWFTAKKLLEEMVSVSECELHVKLYNSLIFVCAKRGLTNWGSKWYDSMIETGVVPDAATVGMLMGLYQKVSNLSQAEYVFGHMRDYKIKCVTAYSAMITIYTRLGMFEKSEEIIEIMEKDGVVPNFENWLVRLNAYSQQGKLEEAESVLVSMKLCGFEPNIVAYNTLITGYGKGSHMSSAKCVFIRLNSLGLTPDETTYRSMVEGFGRIDDYKEALSFYKELKRLGFTPNSSNFYTMVNLQARHADAEHAAQTLTDMRAAGCQYSVIVSTVIQAYQRVGAVDRILCLLEASIYQNVLFDPTSCSLLAVAFVESSLIDHAFRVLHEKKCRDCSNYEDNLYHVLICSCKEAGRYEDAVRFFNHMPKSGSRHNIHIACTMIDVFTIMGKFNKAEDLYINLKQAGGSLDLVAYSVVVRMYIKAEKLHEACSVMEIIRNNDRITPDIYLFRDMLRTYQKCNMKEKLVSTYYWILQTGIHLDEAMYNCIINCCGHAFPVDEVSRLFDEMIRFRFSPNTITINVMLDIYGKARLFSKAKKVFHMACNQGLANVISYNTMIAAYGQNRDFAKMSSLMQRMRSAGYPISLEVYNCMLDAYGKENQLDEFNAILRKMKDAKCEFDHYTYNTMINIYGRKGWIEEVSSVLKELRGRGLELDLYGYNTLIKAYGIAGMVEEAVDLVQEMRRKNINPDKVTYGNLIGALQRNGNILEAVKWSLWMKQLSCAN
ncbi:Pentatricopeptide repeat-containing protein [Rhynchospora pubera]|uniref:Pentatricopeptide repeat-containing protein n=1 Tax=Rhynchospora pubera TaxID=906938 RepID=A0AAV8H8H9_9POAL|nr:Pentatricopeptide repeat-containing protein [Rhynchospora pubera]